MTLKGNQPFYPAVQEESLILIQMNEVFDEVEAFLSTPKIENLRD